MRDLLALDDALNGELPAAAPAMSGFVPPRP
jgi:hypothetical protein